MPTDFADTLVDRLDRDHDDDIADGRPYYTPVYGYQPGIYASTLDSLFRSGNLMVSDTGRIVAIDLTIRRSGLTLYGTGHTLLEAIDDVNDQLMDHIEALNHLENIGIDVERLDEIVAPDYGDYDPAFAAILTDIDRGDNILPETFRLPTQDATAMAPTLAAVGEPIDETPPTAEVVTIDEASPGYILALLIPVREGRA